MKTRIFHSLFAICLALMAGFSVSGTARADDTDIYVNPNSASGSEPMIMFTLDLRSNLYSNVCNLSTTPYTAASVAADCNWPTTFTSYLTATDMASGGISLFEELRAALKWAMDGLDSVKIGILVPHDDSCTGSSTSGPSAGTCSNGGYILYGFHSIDATDSNGNKAAFFSKLENLAQVHGNASAAWQPDEMYFEFFRYLTGQGIYNGHQGWNDFGYKPTGIMPTVNLDGYDNSSPPALVLQNPDNSFVSWDTGIEDATHTTYQTPLDVSMTCARIYVINFAFGTIGNDADSDGAIAKAAGAGGMGLDLSLIKGGTNDKFSSVLNWFYKTDIADGSYGLAPKIDGVQNVISYFMTKKVDNTTNAWAAAGGTGNAIALGSDPSALKDQLKNIFSQILSVSTTFVSASVPVNVFNRADYLDDVYLALFEAEKNANPHWIGNLKKLKLQQDSTGAWFIGDVNGNPAFGADGRINYNALTYWTDPTGADVVNADPKKNELSGLDGRSIDRGGAGQQIPGFLTDPSPGPGLANTDTGARQIFTEPASYTNGNSTSLMALDATTANAKSLWPDLNALGVYASGSVYNSYAWSTYSTYTDAANASSPDTTEALNILKWARGIDVKDEDADTDTTDVRPWLMSDPIHSRPLTINYGAANGHTATNPDVRIVIAGNDGFLHMVQNTDTSGAESGKENWAFIPRYGLRILDRLMNNVSYSKILHPYGVDGTPVLYTHDANGDGNIIKGSCSPTDATDCDKAYMYFGMRRGGRYYYAMDITDPNTPKMLWSISNNNTDFSEMGLTFSNPKVGQISYTSGGTTYSNVPVLVFGGGYDTNKDTRSNAQGSNDAMGNAVYIVDARDGSLIWKAVYGTSTGNASATEYDNVAMVDSIPAEVTPLDSDGDGNIDRIYVGDTGGQVWRLDVAGTDRTQWKSRVFASIGRHSLSNKTNDRRFFHALDVVQTLDATGPYDAVIGGTGDRANPLDTGVGNNVPENWIYMFKDRDTVSGPSTYKTPLYTQSSLTDLSSDCLDTNSCTSTPDLTNGWKIALTQATGEKALSRPITIYGVIYFTTYLPPNTSSTGSCEPSEGTGSQYAMNLQDATAAFNWDQTNSVNVGGTVYDMGATDRYSPSGLGIPADVIAIRKSGKTQTLCPGCNYAREHNGNDGNKTFWYTEGE